MRAILRAFVRLGGLAGCLALSPCLAGPPAAAAFDLAAAVGEDELAAARGGQTPVLQVSEVTETATQNGNVAKGNVTGDNWIGGGAFSGANGFSTVIQNTGNNVLIQESLVINVGIQQ